MPRSNDIHSPEAQEILGRIPSWIVRCGACVIAGVLALILIGAYFIKYPETVPSYIFVTTANAPVAAVAGTSGTLHELLVSNGDEVENGAILAVISSNAQWKDIMEIERELHESNDSIIPFISSEWLKNNYSLGELQPSFSLLKTTCEVYDDYLSRNVAAIKQNLIKAQIVHQKEYALKVEVQKKIYSKDFEYEKKSFHRDSLLFEKKAISLKEYEEAARKVLQAENALVSCLAQETSTNLAIVQLEQQLAEFVLEDDTRILEYEQDIVSAKSSLAAEIEQWKLQYLVFAHTSGKISFTRKWDCGQFISAGEVFVTVTPSVEQEPVGIVKIPQASFGKVCVGQKVNVRLSGYPYMQYGVLVGRIDYLSAVPEAGQDGVSYYTAQVVFPDGMLTTYHKNIALIQKMEGHAEIITKDRRLLMRVLDPIVSVFRSGM